MIIFGNSRVKERIAFFINCTILYPVSSFFCKIILLPVSLKSIKVSKHFLKSRKSTFFTLVLKLPINSMICFCISSFNRARMFLNLRICSVSSESAFISKVSRIFIKAVRKTLGRLLASSISAIMLPNLFAFDVSFSSLLILVFVDVLIMFKSCWSECSL